MKSAVEFLTEQGYDVNDTSWIVKFQDGSTADTVLLIQMYGNYLQRKFNKTLRSIQVQLDEKKSIISIFSCIFIWTN